MKRNWKPFKILTKREQALRIINVILMLGFFVASLTFMLISITKHDFGRTFMTSIVMQVLFVLPLLIELIFGRRLSNLVVFCYVLYIILAGFIGSLLRVYYLFNGYDKIIHCLFGYIFSMPAIFIISLCQDYKKLNPVLVGLFCLLFSLSLELLWEILEFSIDRLLGQTMQGVPIEGYGVPLVTDTMTDMMCNTSGAILFFLHFIIGKKTKLNLGINRIEKELVFKRGEAENPIMVNNDKQEEFVKQSNLLNHRDDSQLQCNNENIREGEKQLVSDEKKDE